MPTTDPLSPTDLRHVNALAVSFPLTGVQALALYHLVGKDRSRVQAALIRAEIADDDAYAGARRRLLAGLN